MLYEPWNKTTATASIKTNFTNVANAGYKTPRFQQIPPRSFETKSPLGTFWRLVFNVEEKISSIVVCDIGSSFINVTNLGCRSNVQITFSNIRRKETFTLRTHPNKCYCNELILNSFIVNSASYKQSTCQILARLIWPSTNSKVKR